MADQVLKTVRITDNIKVEVLQQGKKRKYVIFYDGNNDYITGRRSGYDDTDKNNNTKSEKYDVAMSDDDVIEMALKAYNGRFGTPQKKFYITQKTYSDPAPARTYGNGDKSPYYLNNGCAVNIQWIGRIPNPEFNPGTYSNLSRAAAAGEKDGRPRYLENSTITSTTDNSENKDNFPKSSWSVSPPITDGLSGINLKEVPTDYRDTSSLQNKIVTVTLPKGFTENGGKGYLVWTEDGLQYDSKSIPEDTPFRRTVDIEGVPVDIGGSKPKNQIVYFDGGKSDQHVLEQVINDFISKITSLHGIFRYDLKLCAPDNEACSLIPYKSPLEPPVKVNDLQTPPGNTQSTPTKIKFTIDGLPTEIIIKAKENLDTFTIWTGPIPKVNNGDSNIDDFEDGLDEEYKEGEFTGTEEIIVDGKPVVVARFDDKELLRDDDVTVSDGSGGGVDRGASKVNTPGGSVSNSSVSLPSDLSKVRNSVVITKQNTGGGFRPITSDIRMPNGTIVSGASVAKSMNEFISDVLGPFATFLKLNYPDLHKNWYITSATRGYVPRGGSSTSQHMRGQAIDSQILGATARTPDENIKLLNAILTWYKSNSVGYGQILFETRGNSCWIHWSYTRGNTRLMLARFKTDHTLGCSANTTGRYVNPPLTASSLGF
jgi:hypothetical protein